MTVSHLEPVVSVVLAGPQLLTVAAGVPAVFAAGAAVEVVAVLEQQESGSGVMLVGLAVPGQWQQHLHFQSGRLGVEERYYPPPCEVIVPSLQPRAVEVALVLHSRCDAGLRRASSCRRPY